MAFRIPGYVAHDFAEDIEFAYILGRARRIFPVNSRLHGYLGTVRYLGIKVDDTRLSIPEQVAL